MNGPNGIFGVLSNPASWHDTRARTLHVYLRGRAKEWYIRAASKAQSSELVTTVKEFEDERIHPPPQQCQN